MSITFTFHITIYYLDAVSVGKFELSVGWFAVNVDECRLFILWKSVDET